MPFGPSQSFTTSISPQASTAPSVAMLVVFEKVLFSDPVTGYFIASARPQGKVDIPPAALRKDFSAEPTILIKGVSSAFIGSPVMGYGMDVAGEWKEDDRGVYLDALYVQDGVPTTRQALRAYLSAGRLRGVGPSLGATLVDRYGLDLIRILETDPSQLAQTPGISPSLAAALGASWKIKRAAYRVVSFLGQHGLGESMASRVADLLGADNIEERLRANPYLLTSVDGIGFRKADAVAISLGISTNDPRRIQSALAHVLSERVSSDGHTAIPVSDWVSEACEFVSMPRQDVEVHCQRLADTRQVMLRTLPFRKIINGQPVSGEAVCATPWRLASAENSIAATLLARLEKVPPLSERMLDTMSRYIDNPDIGLDDSQRYAANLIFRYPVSIMTGGPGTGKTTTLRSIVAAFSAVGLSVVLAAPTGRAAKRMTQAIGCTAATIHRKLGSDAFGRFSHDREHPMDGDIFILDESSMVDTYLMAAWLRAIPPTGRLVMVGDADQLPSVGPGNVLRELIDSSQIPTARLTKIHRNSGMIAHTAARVLTGGSMTKSGSDPWIDAFAFQAVEDDEPALVRLEELVDGYLNKGYDPKDIQILTPQKEGPLGTKAVNARLRWRLNPAHPSPESAIGATGFLIGERVMQTRNDYDLDVFNGDMGCISAINPDGSLKVQMDDGQIVKHSRASARQLVMAYAITIHKSQGGERPIILMLCSSRHVFMLNRNLIYTGITRGKEHVVVIGQPRAAAMGVRKVDESARLTGLRAELARERLRLAKPQGQASRP